MKRKLWSILIVALIICAFAVPAFADGESEGEQQQAVNAITAVQIKQGGNTINYTLNGNAWTSDDKLDPGSYTINVTASFADGTDENKGVLINNQAATLVSGSTYTYEVSASDSLTASWPITVHSGSAAQANYFLKPAVKSNNAEVQRVTVTLTPDSGNASTSSVTSFTLKDGVYEGTVDTADVSGYLSFAVITKNSNAEVDPIGIMNNPSAAGESEVVTFSVTAEDGVTKRDYKITATRTATKSSVNTLASLLIKRGSSTVYDSTSPATSRTIENVGTGSVTVTPTVTDTGKATFAIYYNNKSTPESLNNGSATISLSSGTGVANTIKIVVTAENGSTKTYTYTLFTGSQGSSDNDLSSLYVRSGSSTGSTSYTISPKFDKDVTSYKVYVPYERSSVYIHAGKSNSNATLRLDGESFSSYKNVSLSTGSNTFSLKVIAQNGAEQTYNITIYRATSSASDDADLDSLELRTSSSSSSKVSLSPSFSATKDTYTANVSSSQKTVRVYADAYHSSAIVKINGEVLTDSYKTVDLNSTKTTIEVTVLAADYETTSTYKITVTRGESTNNYLSALRVYGSFDYLTLSPAFSKTTTAYTVKLSDDDTYFSLRPTSEDGTADITVDGVAVTSESWSKNINMTGASKVVTIKVTAQSGDVRTYTVTFTKSEPKTIKLNIGKKEADINGKPVTMDAAPYLTTIKGAGYTMVPIRFVSEQLGAKVDYTSTDKPIVITLNGKTVTLTLGKADKAAGLDVAPVAKNGRTYVPLRYVSEQLGATVVYNSTTKLITITQK